MTSSTMIDPVSGWLMWLLVSITTEQGLSTCKHSQTGCGRQVILVNIVGEPESYCGDGLVILVTDEWAGLDLQFPEVGSHDLT